MKLGSLLPIAIFIFAAISCKETGVSPSRRISDTTSHNFVWQIDTLGDGNSSVLNDVFIIDENNIWAVGAIYLKDTSGQIDPLAYNLARWDGTKWNLSRIYFTCDGTGGSVLETRAIFGFGPNDIWISSAGTIARWNGASFSFLCIPSSELPGSIKKIWGHNENSVYVVGYLGTITHYDGNSWRKLNTQTTVDVQDIWGTNDMILAAVSYVAQLGEQKILRINNTQIDSIPWDTGRRVHSVWFADTSFLVASGGGIYTHSTNGSWTEVTQLPLIYTRRVRGLSQNDVFVSGDFGFIGHFNGSTWMYYTGSILPSLPTGSYSSLAYINNLAVAIGFVGNRAIITRASRL